jgi:DNA-binding helix-hairpin-helix protein with protein kinase domain
MVKKLEAKCDLIGAENAQLKKENMEQKELMKEWRASEQQRFARETEAATIAAKKQAELAENELHKLKSANLSSEAINAMELNRLKESAAISEALVSALKVGVLKREKKKTIVVKMFLLFVTV